MLGLAKSALHWIAMSLGASQRRGDPPHLPTHATDLIAVPGAETRESTIGPTYLRLVSGGGKELINKYWSVDEFSVKYFDLREADQSVFRAQSPIEEAEAMAAHFLTLTGQSNIKEGVAIRIYPADLAGLQIRLSDEGEREGSTGVALVDGRHHDLTASEDSLKKLTERILRHHYRGGDRIRIVGEHQIACQIVKARNCENILSPKATSFCDKVLQSHRKKYPGWHDDAI